MSKAAKLAEWVRDARQRTFDLIADLSDEQLLGPCLDIVNPFLWEIGHVAWFQEKWVLRHASQQQPLRTDVDRLYDSAAIAHNTRWDLLLPSRQQTLAYLGRVRDCVLDQLASREPSTDLEYFVLLSVFHEDMHGEAFLYTRQTLGYAPPRLAPTAPPSTGGPLPGDARVPGGTFSLGATPADGFVFDNEKWAHAVALKPFAMACAPVTQAEFAAFVEDGGYRRAEFWSPQGWQWRQGVHAEYPVYWRREAGGWLRRDFDHWVSLEPQRPVMHVNWYEAEAYCRWAGRRLPTEAEWEAAASAERDSTGRLAATKRRFPWGDAPPSAEQANLDGHALGCREVGALAAGDSACGCRQMIGNVWEWVQDDFHPYPGFVADPYQEYSQPWFGSHKVLRGGCWATRARLLRNTWRNFYEPNRRDVWAGFRTCALEKDLTS